MEIDKLDIDTHLSENEKHMLDILDKSSNYLQTEYKKQTDFANLTLTQVFNIWVKTMREIVHDIVIYINNLRNYRKYFNDIDDTSLWWHGIIRVLKDFINIFIKDQRAIYFGVTLIIFALFIFLIGITS